MPAPIARVAMTVTQDDVARLDALAGEPAGSAILGTRTSVARQAMRLGVEELERRARAREARRAPKKRGTG